MAIQENQLTSSMGLAVIHDGISVMETATSFTKKENIKKQL